MKTISKEHIAIIQLRAALKLYSEKDFISAITLAGASEEILGQLAKSTTRTNALELESFMFRMTFPDYNYQAKRNFLRNELKHRDHNIDEVAFDNFKQAATTHIAGAITNYKLYKGFLPKEKIILEFCIEIGLS